MKAPRSPKRRTAPFPSAARRRMPSVLWVVGCRTCGRVTDVSGDKPLTHKRTAQNACPEHPGSSLDVARFVRWAALQAAMVHVVGKEEA